MTRNRLLYSLILIIIFSPAALCEVICSTDLNYKWVRKAEAAPEVVFWKALEVRGKVEEDVKRELERQVTDSKGRILDTCRKEHENLSGCVSTKYSAMANTMQQANFSARKALEFAITADCQRQTGICSEVGPGETKCITKEEPKPAQTEPTKADAKDKKKK